MRASARGHPVFPRFIVGMPRAGTTWLCHSLNEHRDVAAFGESMFWGKSYVPPEAHGCYDQVSLDRVKASLLAKAFESTLAIPGPGRMKCIARADLPRLLEASFARLGQRAAPSEVFLNIACAIARAEGKTHWVEKTPHHLLYAKQILQDLPVARFVVMIREPYSFMLSYKHQRGHENTSASRERFSRRYHPLGGALVWRNSWRAALNMTRTTPGQTLIVRMEEVEASPLDVMRRVQSFFSLPEDPNLRGAPCKINSAFEHGSKPELSDADIAWMNLIAGDSISEAGYQALPRPNDAHEIWRSVFDLPAWSVRLLRDMRQTTAGSVRRHLWRWFAHRHWT